MYIKLTITFLCYLHLHRCAAADGFYKVIGPRIVRPNSEFHVAVATHSTSLPTTVSVAIVGTSLLNARAYNVEETTTVLPYSTNIIRLQVGDIDDGFYKLIARGTGGVQFQSTTTLAYVRKSYTVVIQNDRAVYAPGHRMLFRALILNSDLKPAAEIRNEPILVYITDGQGNRVKEWSRVYATRGVFAESLQLSEHPVLGNWNISVQIHGQVYNKTILVAEYIQPKFLINIEAPKHLTFQENILTANINTMYNFGKKVKGDVTVTVYPTINSGVIQPIFQNPVRKVYPIDGAISVTFDVAKELRLSGEYERTVVIDVAVEEELTGRRQNNSVEVHLHKFNYKMYLIKTADYFKPGMMYTAYVRVTNHDGSPINNDRRTVNIEYGFSRINEVYEKEKIVLDRNGLYKLEIPTPESVNNETALRIEAEYYDLKERLPPVPAAVSFSNNYLQIILETERAILNLDVEVLVNCTEPMKYISYELMGRGDVILANTIRIDNLKQYRFRFTATHAMVPIAHLLVSYVREDGELIADSIDIQVDGVLQNFIDIQTNAVETIPGIDVDLTIRAQPNSYIGLMAIDENVNSLKGDYDLSMDSITSELDYYDPAHISPYVILMKNTKANYAWKQGSSNARDMFYDSGASLLTNSFVTSRRPTLEDIYLRPLHYDTSTVKSDLGVGLTFHTVTRPPLAGPYAFSRIPKPVWDRPKVYLLDNIEDTWLFNNFSSGFEGKTSIRRRIPSSLNTWKISGFSLSPLHGLGLATYPKRIKVSKSFSVFIDLPHHIQRGEVLAVSVIVRNYMDKDINAEVTLHNTEQKFYFHDVSNELNATLQKIELYRKKTIPVKKNSGASVSFFIKCNLPGRVEIKASASSQSNQDTTTKYLNVKAEGETLHFTKTVLLDLTRSGVFNGNISIELPKNYIPNSEKIYASVVGDFLGPTIMNLNNLIRLPIASSEQNLINFIPSLIILKHLQNTQQLTPSIENDAIKNLEVSYQQQLTYRKPDGSFSNFGKKSENSSIWLTAYTAMALVQAKRFIFVEKSVVDGAYEWITNIQSRNGSFVEQNPIIHKDMQSPNENSLALTAFVVLAVMENEHPESTHANVINKGLDYIARNIDEDDSVYTIALCSYVLQRANHPNKLSALNLLDSKAMLQNGMKFWGKPILKRDENNPWNKRPKSLDIEATSYGLLALLEANLLTDAMPVLQWLINQRSNLGSFASTQDTSVGLIALYKMVTKLSSNSDMRVEFKYKKQESSKININRDNAMIVQQLTLGNQARDINITATGSGLALFQISYEYNVNVTGPWPLFILDPQVDRNSDRHHLQLSICAAFVSRNLTDTPESNLAVMEINLPSGFTADVDSLPNLEASQNVEKVLSLDDDTRIVLYFNNMTVQVMCPTISAYQTHNVANQKPVHVLLYDYYDTSRRARIFYRGRPTTFCDICEQQDCENSCLIEAKRQRAEQQRKEDDKDDSSTIYLNCHLLLLLMFLNFIYIY